MITREQEVVFHKMVDARLTDAKVDEYLARAFHKYLNIPTVSDALGESLQELFDANT